MDASIKMKEELNSGNASHNPIGEGSREMQGTEEVF